MSRSAPSRADLKLMSLAASSGHPVSAYQLERWRRHGLIPRPDIQRVGGAGTEAVYPPGTGDLVCALARHTSPGRSYDDLALLAFFSGADIPESALKVALARTYFDRRFTHEDRMAREAAAVPPQWAAEMDAEYENAEARAKITLSENGRAVRQMRINLRRLPDLADAPRAEVNARLLAVLIGLERLALPEDDHALMADLAAALDLDCDGGEDCLAVWDYAAVCHASQMARYQETSPEERLDKLVRISFEELTALRDEVLNHIDQMWTRATRCRQTRAPMNEPRQAQGAAGLLVEWMSAREVHPPGSVLADRYFIESLADLSLRCWVSAASAQTGGSAPGEGRAAFIARTSRPPTV
ncbi:hypothetical protein [Streptomyces camelliae]|uniref:HTH merR-type domain-containing protein n=1 Tax=Streptomyces camelliae TaxID=3004093 RepID=A0ABY7PEI5_9ACTN|nr:hypothetical protein [Streptomyces sp. HUAS 2-6]WBO69039.1 hypothetical protein O1G22_42920 [Streptomyces sp. HUAS 2-6]